MEPNDPNKIAECDEFIKEWHDEWKMTRAFIAGARVVRSGDYLPRFPSVDKDQHKAIVDRTEVFPGASRTHKGLMGLLFRKPPVITCPDAYRDVLNTITAEGDSVLDLTEDTADGTLSVNFNILLTDYPAAEGPVSLADAIDKGIRPRTLFYAGETILGVVSGVVNNRRRPINIRLKEDEKTIRELRLDSGVYNVVIWREDDATGWYAAEHFTPTRQLPGGVIETLDEIPATIVTTGRKFKPHTAPMFDVCDLNRSHFIASANLATNDYWATSPTPWITGSKPVETIAIGPGNVWQFEEATAKVGILQADGSHGAGLQLRADTIKEHMAAAGLRILASEKAAAESAMALEIRNSAETATLDGVARVVERAINDQLGWVAWWLGLDPVDGAEQIRIEMSSDFVSAKLTPDERKVIVAEWQAGVYSLETAVGLLTAGNALPEDYDFEADRDVLAQEVADRPEPMTLPGADVDPDAEPTD